MVRIKCTETECQKCGVYYHRRDPKLRYCTEHRPSTDYIIFNKCLVQNCDRRGYYGDPYNPNIRKSAYCRQHRPDNFTRENNYCFYPGCSKTANYGLFGVSRRHVYCKDHRPTVYLKFTYQR